MNAIEFLSNPGAPCGGGLTEERVLSAIRAMQARSANGHGGRVRPTVPAPPPPKGIEGTAPAVDWDATMKRVTEHLEEVMEGMPERPGFWARVFGRRSAAAAVETAALRRRLVARDEQIEVLKKRVQSLREDLGASRSAHLKAEVHLHLMTGTIERLEPVTIRHRNRAEHWERRFVELQAELAEVREELAVSELARRELIAQ